MVHVDIDIGLCQNEMTMYYKWLKMTSHDYPEVGSVLMSNKNEQISR